MMLQRSGFGHSITVQLLQILLAPRLQLNEIFVLTVYQPLKQSEPNSNSQKGVG